ncbi:hypothetical protein LCGC14_3129690, partial [marine sediment metagenome]
LLSCETVNVVGWGSMASFSITGVLSQCKHKAHSGLVIHCKSVKNSVFLGYIGI